MPRVFARISLWIDMSDEEYRGLLARFKLTKDDTLPEYLARRFVEEGELGDDSYIPLLEDMIEEED